MPNFICTTCGTQFAESDQPPEECKICTDERQYVGWQGQQWTTLDDLRQSHQNVVRLEELGLYGIGMEPSFAIGQRALLITHPDGNVLWDCVPLIDDGLVEMVKGIGGISAIAVSHPHYYSSMIDWAKAFDCPVYLHAADRQWVMRPDAPIEFWEGETKEIGHGLTLIGCGGRHLTTWPGINPYPNSGTTSKPCDNLFEQNQRTCSLNAASFIDGLPVNSGFSCYGSRSEKR